MSQIDHPSVKAKIGKSPMVASIGRLWCALYNIPLAFDMRCRPFLHRRAGLDVSINCRFHSASCHYLVQFFGYVMDVLWPECTVRILADVHDITFKEVSLIYHS